MTTITANIPARKLYGKTYQAHQDTITKDDTGRWSHELYGAMLEADVIEMCKSATNWQEIRQAHFPMYGFHR